MALTTVSSDRLSTNVKNTNFTAAEKQDLTDDIKPLLGSSGGGNKNLIINGAMQVAARATSSTTSGYGDLDRWKHEYAGTDEAPTFAQSAVVSSDSGDNPFAKGITNCTKITNGNQTGGFQNNRLLNFNQNIEAQNVRNSGWNYNSSSSFLTLSYYVKASVSQEYFGFIKTVDGTNYIYPFSLGTLTANTWTKITKTIPGNSNLQIDDDANSGFQVFPIFFGGTDYTDSGVTNDAWATWSSGSRSEDQPSSWWTTNDSTIEITGIQLEVGSVATDFEHRSFAQELALCQRYFYMHASGAESSSTGAQAPIGLGYGYTSSDCYLVVKYPVTMRAYPSMSKVVGTDYFGFFYNNNSAFPDNVANNRVATNSAEIYFYGGASWDQNAGGMVRVANSATRLGFSAEL